MKLELALIVEYPHLRTRIETKLTVPQHKHSGWPLQIFPSALSMTQLAAAPDMDQRHSGNSTTRTGGQQAADVRRHRLRLQRIVLAALFRGLLLELQPRRVGNRLLVTNPGGEGYNERRAGLGRPGGGVGRHPHPGDRGGGGPTRV